MRDRASATKSSARKTAAAVTGPVTSARAAGLRYVMDTRPGITRKTAETGINYIGIDGKTIEDPEELRRIKSLAIPPAWRDVWICPLTNGHLQATGRDAKGRKQYRYHLRWREVRDETKYDRMLAFGRALPLIRRRVQRDLAKTGLPREKVLATVVRLLETTLIRVGNDEYARRNDSFGLTTMRDHHVDVSGATVTFQFKGKSGIKHTIDITDRRLANIVRRSRDLPGFELFQYLDDAGKQRDIEAADVNAYLRDISGQEFTAKDFRTWAGTVLAAEALQEFEAFDSHTQAKRNVVKAIEAVAKRLGNTKAVCRKCYIHPEVISTYMSGELVDTVRQRLSKEMAASLHDLPPEEAAVMALLQARLKRDAGNATGNGRSRRKPQSLARLLRKSLAGKVHRDRRAEVCQP